MGDIISKLSQIQAELNAPKNQRNNFGNYNYRSAEDITEAVKPHLAKHGVALVLGDEIVEVGGRVYVQATATLIDADGNRIEASGWAREADSKKGMDDAQVTGSTSSYARKYAMNGLFAIDDSKDADTNEHARQAGRGEVPKKSQGKPAVKKAAPAKKAAPSNDAPAGLDAKKAEALGLLKEKKIPGGEFKLYLMTLGEWDGVPDIDSEEALDNLIAWANAYGE
ncbi:Erf-like ssDNA annealing protein [Gordonia phage Rabbitrun]|uniref:ERF family ssDNA binding protein n=1 Tax=Gordonia phage Rabbitrun TaxID=2762280 RepID=A0A7G8LIN1_9CAUD|nr:Erf-like ssDNA annealing protein [Gordonia phage Rabbitrun]QNJ57103.1 ERF family ssDNA binding protein [Gordonia phage Rabbitrun]